MKLNFPKQIYQIVKDLKYSVDNIGRSEDKVIIFEDKYVLKISKSKADIVVLCSSDDEYAELVAGALPILKGAFKHIVVAGNPVEQMESFNAQGVTDYVNVRTNALESLTNYNKQLL